MAEKKIGKKTNKKVMEAIKEMERESRVEIVASLPPPLPVAERIFFDQWWANKSKRIPPIHRKEVIFADFKGRGLTNKETTEAYDLGLKKYGLDIA